MSNAVNAVKVRAIESDDQVSGVRLGANRGAPVNAPKSK
jgi:hypothetical protein